MKESGRFETAHVMKAFMAATESQTKWVLVFLPQIIADL